MAEQEDKVLKIFNSRRIGLTVLIGLIVIGYLFYDEITNNGLTLSAIGKELANANFFWVFLALLVLLVRDGGYMYRIKHLTMNKLSWKSCFQVIVLWEFASAVTPSVVGGTAVAVFILNKEKIPLGKSLAYVLVTAILDNLFFVIAGCLVMFSSDNSLFPNTEWVSREALKNAFYISYLLISSYSLLMIYGIFINPRGFKYILMKLTSWGPLRRGRKMAHEQGTQMINAANELRSVSIMYWVKAVLVTFFIWTARYFMLNCLVAAFSDGMSFWEHFQAISRQIVMWIAQLVSPTPGASGIAEGLFKVFFKDILSNGGVLVIVLLLWRFLTYFAYLVLGSIVLPRWLKKVFVNR
ncbi:MAG: YbhN family protein [Cyclobacteriaceae bacterium]